MGAKAAAIEHPFEPPIRPQDYTEMRLAGNPVTDDNQLLAYGLARLTRSKEREELTVEGVWKPTWHRH